MNIEPAGEEEAGTIDKSQEESSDEDGADPSRRDPDFCFKARIVDRWKVLVAENTGANGKLKHGTLTKLAKYADDISSGQFKVCNQTQVA